MLGSRAQKPRAKVLLFLQEGAVPLNNGVSFANWETFHHLCRHCGQGSVALDGLIFLGHRAT